MAMETSNGNSKPRPPNAWAHLAYTPSEQLKREGTGSERGKRCLTAHFEAKFLQLEDYWRVDYILLAIEETEAELDNRWAHCERHCAKGSPAWQVLTDLYEFRKADYKQNDANNKPSATTANGCTA